MFRTRVALLAMMLGVPAIGFAAIQPSPPRPAGQAAPAVPNPAAPDPTAPVGPASPAPAAAPANTPPGTTPRPAATRSTPPSRTGDTIQEVRIDGNQRIEAGTIRSYMLVQAGDSFDPDQLDRSLKTLYATGLFSDVKLQRQGNTLVVHVVENPIVDKVVFEGNHKLDDNTLRPVVSERARTVFTPTLAQEDRQKLLDYYAKRGRFGARVEPKIIKLDQNRVTVVFEINEGDLTLISRIVFVGNHAFSEGRLRDVINERETAWYRFLSTTDEYDPEKVTFDRELLRRFYLQKGYADFEVSSTAAELTPDKTAFFLTFMLNEGPRYRISKTDVNITLRGAQKSWLEPLEELGAGDWYDGDAVERTVQAMTTDLENRGFAFAQVQPRVARDRDKHTIALSFDVSEGPRVYVERIDIVGNARTEDKVIRREYRLAEGDPFNAALIRRSRQRVEDLDYFQNVETTSAPGSAPDKSVLNTTIQEKSTGELSLGGGYSTDVGALASAGLREKNFIGTGIDAGINGTLAQKETQVNLSVTDPYFLDRNLVAGFDLFRTQTSNLDTQQYNERRTGATLRLGYEFNEHLRQLWSYSIVQRDVYDVQTTASLYVQDQAGQSLLSEVSQTLSLDYRDSKIEPHSGYIIRVGNDFAGLGGNTDFVRTKIDASYYVPLDRFTGNADWGITISAGAGYLATLNNRERIIDRFFLGGDNLRGFQTGGVGPHAVNGGDSLGGRFLYTQSTELHYPLPISPDLGVTGRAFVDVGGLFGLQRLTVMNVPQPTVDYRTPRIGVGVGISWKTPFGLINIDLGQALLKRHYDETQLVRFGIGTRF